MLVPGRGDLETATPARATAQKTTAQASALHVAMLRQLPGAGSLRGCPALCERDPEGFMLVIRPEAVEEDTRRKGRLEQPKDLQRFMHEHNPSPS